MTDSKNLKFTKTHEWVLSGDGEVTIGITEHAQELLGDVVFVDLKKVGEEVNAGDVVGVVESVKAASDIYAPLNGKIKSINESLTDNPGLLNQDPFGEGWLLTLEVNDLEQMHSLLTELDYQNEIKE